MKETTKTWLKAAGVRAVRTIAQSALSVIGVTTAAGDVNWKLAASSAVLAGVVSVLMSLKGLPEIK